MSMFNSVREVSGGDVAKVVLEPILDVGNISFTGAAAVINRWGGRV